MESNFSENDIKKNFPSHYFERGYDYYTNGNIINPVIRENRLEAYCEGSYPEPYRVSITLDSKNFTNNICSCPLGGDCKHVIALLLTWVNDKESFLKLPSIEKILKEKTKNELLEIVKEMLERDPELVSIIERSNSKNKTRKTKVNPEIYRRQIGLAMEYSDRWHNRNRGADEIGSVMAVADKFLENEDYVNAFIVYDAIVQETLDNYNMVHDEGEIAAEIDSVIEGLSICLSKQERKSEDRLKILKTLFDTKKWDIQQGGYGIGDEVPEILTNDTTFDERKKILAWIDEAINEGTSNWGRVEWGYFLLSIYDADNNDEGFFKKAEELGLYKPMFDKLVMLKKIDNAIEIARNYLTTSDWERLRACEKLTEYGFKKEAIAFALEGIPNCKDNRLKEWLAEIYEKQKEYLKSQDLYIQIWKDSSNLTTYKHIKRLAENLRNWFNIKKELIQGLEEKKNFDLLTEIFLFEKDWDTAWNYAEKIQRNWMSYSDIKLQLAKASKKYYPEKAIKVYYDYALKLINRRGRHNYADASLYLKNMLKIYSRIGNQKKGKEIISDIRIKNKNLPALQDEITQAGL